MSTDKAERAKTAVKIFVISLTVMVFATLLYGHLKNDNVAKYLNHNMLRQAIVLEQGWQDNIIYGALNILFYPVRSITAKINGIIVSLENKTSSEYTAEEAIFISLFSIAFLLFISAMIYFTYTNWFRPKKKGEF